MITSNDISNFIDKIPPAPKILQETILYLNNGDLTKAAKIASEDPALSSYLKNLVNKPLYGLKNEVIDNSQIFGILGVSASQQSVYNYMLTLLSPSEWKLFKLNKSSFYELQAILSTKWQLILEHLDIKDKDIESSITLLPASIIVSEALFANVKNDVEMLRSVHDLNYNTILKRLCNTTLFDICEQIATKWEMPKIIPEIINCSSGISPSQNKEINNLGKWMHLLLFYELSQSIFVEAELNDFIEFNVEYVEDIYEEFLQIMEIS